MARCSFSCLKIIWLLCGVGLVTAQEESACYSGGSIAASVIITILVVLLLGGLTYFGWKRYGKYKKGKHLILETDPEKGHEEYAFDNPGFKDAGLTPIGKAFDKNSKLETEKPKWTQWSPLGVLTNKNEKRKTVDDFAIDEGTTKVVSLRSHDFTGLGFNICGNMRDGIFIKDVLHRGPASESGKLSPGDRISSITISFEHIVYEDALTILSYASPYEVIIQARNGKLTPAHATPSGQPGHPLYRSSSSTDLLQIGKSAKKRLFQAEEPNDSASSNYSSLQKTRSTATTLERSQQESPKQKQGSKKQSSKTQLNPEQLKTQLEQRILEEHNENLKNKQNYDQSLKLEVAEPPKTENKFQKFGIKVLPMEQREQKSPKSTELSQNDNNINIERHIDSKIVEAVNLAGIDEVDKIPPPVKKREKKIVEPVEENLEPEPFLRKDSAGIKRDENGIPQEIPSHMLSAATAARRNRKTSEDRSVDKEDAKTPKKQKGKAPAPPDGLRSSTENIFIPESPHKLDGIFHATDPRNEHKSDESSKLEPVPAEIKSDFKDYNSDSDVETDNQSSVNTIELNSSHITIHQTEDTEDKQNRKTASTGDLTKIQKTRKTSTGTLERAQSLDITDTGMPVLTKKRKGGKLDDNFDSKTSSDDSLYGDALIHKEPRLSLILDGLNTFQRSRLKKSTEWGNLEDAILNLSKNGSSESLGKESSDQSFEFRHSGENFGHRSFDFGTKSPEFDALVNKVNEIKQETCKTVDTQEKQIKEDFDKIELVREADEDSIEFEDQINKVKNDIWPVDVAREQSSTVKSFNTEMNPLKQLNENIDETKKLLVAASVPVETTSKVVKNEIWPTEFTSNSGNNNNEFRISADFSCPSKPQRERTDELREAQDTVIPISPTDVDGKKVNNETWPVRVISPEKTNSYTNFSIHPEDSPTKRQLFKPLIYSKPEQSKPDDEIITILNTNLENSSKDNVNTSYDTDVPSRGKLNADIKTTYDITDAIQEDPQMHYNVQTLPDTDTSPKTNAQEAKLDRDLLEASKNLLFAEREASAKHIYNIVNKLDDTNISDDIKVSRHSLGSLERPKFSENSVKSINLNPDKHNISNVTVSDKYVDTNVKPIYETFNRTLNLSKDPNISDLYTTALDETLKNENGENNSVTSFEKVIVSTPDLIKNVSIAEAIHDLNNEVTVEGPTSLTFEIPGKAAERFETRLPEKNAPAGLSLSNGSVKNYVENIEERSHSESSKLNPSLTYVTEIQVLTPNTTSNKNISEIEIIPSSSQSKTKNLDNEFENYVKNFESSLKSLDDHTQPEQDLLDYVKSDIKNTKSIVIQEKIDPEKELHKIHEIAEEQLKKLPEMRFTTSSYEPVRSPEKRQSQIELLRSNFEKSPSKTSKPELPPIKSRIPIATTTKTPPTSPERRDSRNLDLEMDKEIIEIMSSGIHSTPIASSLKYLPKTANRNVTVTSIRNSKIPSGLPTYGNNRPPVPPRKSESGEGANVIQLSTNGASESSFKQWVFNPSENSVTNITVKENKTEK